MINLAIKSSFAKLLLSLLLPIMALSSFAKDQILISSAISLSEPLKILKKEFEIKYPGYDLLLNFSSSGRLFQQIKQTNQIDVFISANSKYTNSYKIKAVFVKNTLVLIKNSKYKTLKLDNIKKHKIVMGNPTYVPMGLYARKLLERKQLWTKLQEQMVFVENARQAMRYLHSEDVDFAFVYKSEYLKSPRDYIIESEFNNMGISYSVALVNEKRHKFYQKWKAFLLSDYAQTIFEKYHFERI